MTTHQRAYAAAMIFGRSAVRNNNYDAAQVYFLALLRSHAHGG